MGAAQKIGKNLHVFLQNGMAFDMPTQPQYLIQDISKTCFPEITT
jgi:hypothetical protein